MNRLIAEARHPTGEIFAPVAGVYEPQAEIRPAGLSGPITLRAYALGPQDQDRWEGRAKSVGQR